MSVTKLWDTQTYCGISGVAHQAGDAYRTTSASVLDHVTITSISADRQTSAYVARSTVTFPLGAGSVRCGQ